ncbi:MAG: ATP-binding cassette domain-containing protein [Defluviitaleaceae bacterium]|nr:ATP-binding cassette domain-containing protein [Defluviitaleaceae bacterium]
MALLEVKNLKVYYPIKGGIMGRTVGYVKAVNDISFEINEGETIGLIGESGCGKTTTGKAILGLVPITSGSIIFNGEDITKYINKNRSSYRKSVQMIFQDVFSSMNPKERILDIIAEPLRNFEKLSKAEERKRVDELLAIVGMTPENALKYPHQFSGGQRQRIGVARALALKPKLIVCDEPVSALDLSVQAQVLNYLKDVQEEFGLSYLFISHDLGVVQHMCQKLKIMHRARFVEIGTSEEIYNNPLHIYTKRLLTAVPDMDPTNRAMNEQQRKEVEKEYESSLGSYYGEDSSVYDLKKINDDHYVAIP